MPPTAMMAKLMDDHCRYCQDFTRLTSASTPRIGGL
jgi:hypothetical protein